MSLHENVAAAIKDANELRAALSATQERERNYRVILAYAIKKLGGELFVPDEVLVIAGQRDVLEQADAPELRGIKFLVYSTACREATEEGT